MAPLTEAVAEQFQAENPGVKVTVGTSGTGGGFEKFCAGETDISDASRAIEPEEVEACKKDGVGYEEVQVATDALTVMINTENPVACLTVDQLNAVWGPDSKHLQLERNPGPDKRTSTRSSALFGPGTDSGTFDYFTESINGEEGATRKDYNNVGEDDNATVTGVEGSPGGMGYFGFSFYQENEGKPEGARSRQRQRLRRAVGRNRSRTARYAPLSRPLFMYPSEQALKKPEVKAFIDYYLENVNSVRRSARVRPADRRAARSKSEAAAQKIGA